MHSRFQDLVPVHLKDEGDPELDKPSEEDIEEVCACYYMYMCIRSNTALFSDPLGF